MIRHASCMLSTETITYSGIMGWNPNGSHLACFIYSLIQKKQISTIPVLHITSLMKFAG